MPVFDIASFGASGDGLGDDSAAFEAALDAVRKAGGGTLRVGKGLWRSGPLELCSRTTLLLEEGAVIAFSGDPGKYPPALTRWEGVECYAMRPLVFARDGEDIAVTGKGKLDGNGSAWWNALREKRRRGQKGPESPEEKELARLNPGYAAQSGGGGGRGIQFLRPPLMQFLRCRGVRVEGITLANSPFWTLHPVFCRDLVIRGLRIVNPKDAPNTDGIDIDSCREVLIEGCFLSVGDDGIALKSGSGEEGRRAAAPTEGVTVRDCVVEAAHGGIVIGSETAGGVSRVLAENCRFSGTDRGIRIKTRRGRGGEIRDLVFRGLVMENNLCPLAINMYYRCGAEAEAGKKDGPFSREALPVNEGTPSIKNILVEGCRASGCRASAGFVAGLPESPVENLTIRDCVFSTSEEEGQGSGQGQDPGQKPDPSESDMFLGIPPVSERGVRLLNTRGFSCENVTVEGSPEPFVYR